MTSRRATKKPDAPAETLAIVEHTLIYRLIARRKGKKAAKHISLDELLKEQKIAGYPRVRHVGGLLRGQLMRYAKVRARPMQPDALALRRGVLLAVAWSGGLGVVRKQPAQVHRAGALLC